MMKSTGGTILVIMAILLSVITLSCGTPAPKVLDIAGIREWKPLQEGTLICASADEDKYELSYAWSTDNGTIKGEGKQVTWTAPDSQGDCIITVKVTDAQGREAVFHKTFKVLDDPYHNDTPDKTIYLKLSLPSSEVVSAQYRTRVWTTPEIQCDVTGAEESDLTYQWTATAGKLMGDGIPDGKARKVGWVAPGVAGQYKVSVTVTDKSGNKADGEVDFIVLCCRDK